MELFSAGDESQLDAIKRWILESDIYLLILGARYGSLQPHSGLSYTEIEYDYAVANNKPHFALVLSNDALQCQTATPSCFEGPDPERSQVLLTSAGRWRANFRSCRL